MWLAILETLWVVAANLVVICTVVGSVYLLQKVEPAKDDDLDATDTAW